MTPSALSDRGREIGSSCHHAHGSGAHGDDSLHTEAMSALSWVFPPAESADENGVVGVGADLTPETVLTAYSRGLFPMPVEAGGPIVWWSPDPRAILPLDRFHISRSLRRSMRRFRFTIDTAFDEVVEACADPARPHGWIDDQMREAYGRLHRRGWAHSVETRTVDGRLVGGIYGVGFGGFFAGESMFHRENDASKAALATLVGILRAMGAVLFDVQWQTPHLASLGAVEIPRSEYLRRLEHAISAERPARIEWEETVLSPGPNRPTSPT